LTPVIAGELISIENIANPVRQVFFFCTVLMRNEPQALNLRLQMFSEGALRCDFVPGQAQRK